MNKFKEFIKSQNFIYITFGFFIIQAIVYTSVIGLGIPSDEQYHYSSTQYYAQQPIQEGPFTKNQTPDTIRDIRYIDSNPSYLHHYIFSFFARVFNVFELSKDVQVLLLRLFNISMAVLSIYFIKKILDQISKEKIVKNLAIAAYVLTGATVWLAASINYDNMANLFWFVFLYVGIKFIKKPSVDKLLVLVALALLVPLTKFTFAPFMMVGLMAILGIAFYKHGRQIKVTANQFRNLKTVLLVGLVIVALGLFAERIGGNFVNYGRVQPKCDQFFTIEECRTNAIYNRNFVQREKFSEEDQRRIIRDWDPFTYTGEWTYKMYNSLPWYLGHQRIESNNYSEVIAALLGALALVTALFSRRKLKLNTPAKLVLAITIIYTAGVFLFNLNTYLSIGMMYAYQGRYLLPVLAFAYFFVILLVISSYRQMGGRTKTIFGWVWIIILALYLLSHFTPLVSLVGMDESWFREYTIEITP